MSDHNQPKSNGPLYIIIILLVCVLAVLSMMIVNDKKARKAEKKDKRVVEETLSLEDSSEDENASEDGNSSEEDKQSTVAGKDKNDAFDPAEDPLAGHEVLYPGEAKAGMKATTNLVNFFLSDTGMVSDDILSVNVCDFEESGSYQAFIFAGNKNESEYETTFSGSVYFTDGNVSQKLADSETDAWWTVDGFLDFGKRKYAYATEYYTTGGRSLIWTVKNGIAKECEISGMGDVCQLDNGQISFVLSSYDTTFSDGMLMGHSWKPYYFDYDSDKDCLFEYGGAFLALEDVEDKCGFDLVSMLQNAGHTVTYALYRGNGVLTVSFYDVQGDGDYASLEYGNVNYDCNAKCYLGWGGRPVESLEESNVGGVYESCCMPDLAVFPEVKKHTTTEMIAVRGRMEIFSNGVILLHGVNHDNWEIPLAALVDHETIFGSDPNGFIGSDIAGKTPVSWLTELCMSENFMDYCGVYELEMTNGHADVIKGLYWWD